MINDQCPMINERGYALIAMVFVLVSFISVVFLVSYPLIKEARDDTAIYIIDRKDYRWRKAWFGEAVDQSGTKLAHSGGLLGGDVGGGWSWGGPRSHSHGTKVVARVYAHMISKSRGEVLVPHEYRYKDTLWGGYWGKRYLHILPSDDWNYDVIYSTGRLKRGGYYAPYRQPYAGIGTGAACAGVPHYGNKAKGTEFWYQGYETIYLEVKDYSKEKDSHELRLVLIGSDNSSIYMYPQESESDEYCSNDYVLYMFWIDGNKYVSVGPGQKKLMIQVRQNGADNWITMDTKFLCVPTHVLGVGKEILTFRVDFYG